jgi:competence protein ComFC
MSCTRGRRVNDALGRFADGFLDLFLPRRCVQCGAPGRWLCATCTRGLRSLTGPCCTRCGRPGAPQGAACPECRGRDLGFVSARAAYASEGAARKLVTACKFRSLRSLGAEMAALATPAFAAGLVAGSSPADVVTCVPVHRDRRLERGFNQAELLARELARGTGLRFVPALTRARRGERQSGLRGAARAANVAGAFALTARAAPLVVGRERVVIVDDVYTTGETLSQCAKALRDAGCEVHAFTFARAVRRHLQPEVAEISSAKEQRR